MSDLPPPPEPPSGWPQPGTPAPGYGAPPPPPPAGGPWGAPASYGAGPPQPGYGVQKANFGQRLVAFIIDIIILNIMLVPAWAVLFNGDTEWVPCRIDEEGDRTFDDDVPINGQCEEPTDGTVAISLGVGALGVVGYLIYVGRLEGRTGATLGARAMGIKVVDMNTGLPIGGGRAVGRWFGSLISRVVCLLGYLWMLWDDQSQTWHDKMTNAVVVRT